ncbi:MAG: cytochrome-c peroxidase, partial [Byssovorax sp.]
KPLPPMPKAPALPATPEGLAELKALADNALTAEKVMLGKQLFFDKRLSKDGSASCETCHVPEKGWTDGTALSKKVGGAMNVRHSPTMINVGYNDAWYWDGRAETLEKNVEAAWKGQLGADPAVIAAALAKIPLYVVEFKAVFNSEPTPDAVNKALASFIRTIRSGGSPWDLHEKGDKKAASDSAARGWELFRNKANCASCHAPPAFTDNGFHNTGIGFDKPEPDTGRGKIAKDEKLDGAFKTPTLRSVTTHAPYFHDGRAETIEAAVDYMLSGGIKEKNKNLDPKMKAVKLSTKEREDLLAFVKALEAPATPFERPTLPE